MDNLANKLDERFCVSLDKIDWAEAGKTLKWAVLIKLANGKVINKERAEEVMEKIWKVNDAATFWKVEKDMLLVNFQSKHDQIRVLEGGPWSLGSVALLLQKWESGMIREDFTNVKINITVHMYRLPYELKNKVFAKELLPLRAQSKKIMEAFPRWKVDDWRILKM